MQRSRSFSLTFLSLTLLTFPCLHVLAQTLEIPVVTQFEKINDPSKWEGRLYRGIPIGAIQDLQIDFPAHAHKPPLRKIALQNDFIHVCHKNCNEDQSILTLDTKNLQDFVVSPSELRSQRKRRKERIVQAMMGTTYYWVTKLYNMLEQDLGYRFDSKLRIHIQRPISDITTGLELENNAFFNPRDFSLSFLPSSRNILLSLVGMQLQPSALDPTVAVHEAGHAVFHELIKREVFNSDINGLNEGFADYLAYVVTGQTKIGTVMTSGSGVRDISRHVRNYTPRLPVHDLGEVFGHLFYSIRQMSEDKAAADKIVIESIRKLSSDYPSTTFTYLRSYLSMIQSELPRIYKQAERMVVKLFPTYYEEKKDIRYEFDPINPSRKRYKGVTITSTYPTGYSVDYGLSHSEDTRFVIFGTRESKQYEATWYELSFEYEQNNTPMWILYSNSTNAILSVKDAFGNDFSKEGLYFAILNKLAKDFQMIRSWMSTRGSEYLPIFEDIIGKRTDSEVSTSSGINPIRVRRVKEEFTFINFRGQMKPLTIIEGQVRLQPLLAGITLITKPLRRNLNPIERIRLYFTGSEYAPKDIELPKFGGDAVYIGYEVELKTGVKVRALVEDFHQD